MDLRDFQDLGERLPPRLSRWLAQVIAAQNCFGVDATLMLAIIDRESLGGDALKPQGPSGLGDGGFGHGLCQIDGRFHHRFIAAEFDTGGRLWADATFNIMYAARLMGRNFLTCRNDWPTTIAAYNCGVSKARGAVLGLGPGPTPDAMLKALDAVTTGGDYVSDVMARRAKFTDIKLLP